MSARVGWLVVGAVLLSAWAVSCGPTDPDPDGGQTQSDGGGNTPDGGGSPDGGGTLPDGGTTSCVTAGCPFYLTCNTATGACDPVLSCPAQVQCTVGLTSCAAGSCGVCQSDSDCGGGQPKCETTRGFACVQCLSDADCPSTSPTCTLGYCFACNDTDRACPAGEQCVQGACSIQCSADSNCPAARPYCDTQGMWTRYCSACRTDLDCGDGLACQLGVCRPEPRGGTCKNPTTLTFTAGRAVVDGQFTQGYWGAGFWTPAAAYYRLDVTAESLLDVTTSNGSSTQPLIEVFDGDACSTRYKLAESSAGAITGVHLTPGTYFLRYHYSNGGPRWRMTVQLTPTTRPAGTSCTKPIELAVGAAGVVSEDTATLDPTQLVPLPGDPCSAPYGDRPDALLGFTLAEPKNLVITTSPENLAEAVQAELVASCYPPNDQYCRNTTAGDQVLYEQANAGPLLLRVRNLGSNATVNVRAGPFQTNDSCYSGTPVVFSGGKAVIRGHTDFLPPTWVGGCDGNSHDLHTAFFRFDTTGLGARSLAIKVLSSERSPRLYVDRDCSWASSADYCLGAETRYWDVESLPAGPHVLEVTEAGAFELELTLAAPYPNVTDWCYSNQEVVVQPDNTFLLSSDTRGANDDFTPSCGGISATHAGKDLAFYFYLAKRGRAQLTVTPGDPSFDPVIAQVDYSGCPSTEFRCFDQGGPGQAEPVDVRFNSSWYFMVDGADGSQGPFTLSGTWTPAPANDECSGITTLTFGQTVTGDLSAAFADPGLGCAAPLPGPDLFYKFTALSNGTATVTLTPTGFDGALAASNTGFNCSTAGGATCSGTANAAGVGGVETLTFAVARNATYNLIVSGDTNATGTFTLSLAGP